MPCFFESEAPFKSDQQTQPPFAEAHDLPRRGNPSEPGLHMAVKTPPAIEHDRKSRFLDWIGYPLFIFIHYPLIFAKYQ